MKHSYCKLALAACTLLATAGAFAQSAEYRRGYDDGYRAGRDSVRSPQHSDRGDDGRQQMRIRIRILDARYGRGRRLCDARPAVQQIVNQQGETDFEVSNNLCGDSAPGETKTLEVTYQCGRDNPVRASADEGRGMRIRCR